MQNPSRRSLPTSWVRLALASVAVACAGWLPATAQQLQVLGQPAVDQAPGGYIAGERVEAVGGVAMTMAELQQRQQVADAAGRNPGASAAQRLALRQRLRWSTAQRQPSQPGTEVARWPAASQTTSLRAPAPQVQTIVSSFDGPTLADAGSYPPDTMGAIGPTQFVAALNGRFRSYTRAGVADGVMDIDPDLFFNPVMSPVAGNFTSDPRIRYDRQALRWIIVMIDVPNNGSSANRLMIAYSDGPILTATTLWRYAYFNVAANLFLDYPTLGVDANALYIGGNMFSTAGNFSGCDGYVVQKATLLAGGPVVVTRFANMVSGAGSGPFTPQGVDNFDPNPLYGYFIGVDNAGFGLLQLRRVSNPGGSGPGITGNLGPTVAATALPIEQNHLGNTGGNNGRVDTLDDRLYSAVIRNGTLWTAHNIGTGATGVASSAATRRNSARWYQIGGAGGLSLSDNAVAPTLVQSGTLFDPRAETGATSSNRRGYIIPSVMVNGQGHMVLGSSVAAADEYLNAFATYRQAGDSPGTLRADGTPANSLPYTASSFAYNPPADPGPPRRWGDYSYTSLDPTDDMTMWTIQEYTQSANTWGVRIAQIQAPPPATIATVSPSSIPRGARLVNVTVTGVPADGAGFYDPGAGFPRRLTASVSGGVIVRSVTYVNPTTVVLGLTTGATRAAGARTITITNPDGQSTTSAAILNVFIP